MGTIASGTPACRHPDEYAPRDDGDCCSAHKAKRSAGRSAPPAKHHGCVITCVFVRGAVLSREGRNRALE